MLTRRAFIGSAAAVAAFDTLPSRLLAQSLAADQGVRYGLGFDDITSLDPHMAVLSSDIPIVANVYDGLLTVPNGDLTSDRYLPGLAERWESSSDKKQWTFFLRKGVPWHGNYGEFSSDDAKFTIERVAGKGFTSPFRGTMTNVDRVDTDGPSTLRVTLKEPDPYFLQLVVNYQAGYVACKKAAESGADLKTHPIGTGPFKFSSYQSRDKLVLVRNDHWWGGKVTVDQLVFQFMSQQSTRELALRTGDINATDLDSRQDVIDRVRRQKAIVDLTTSGSPYVLYINVTKKPFDDVRVRRALAHATDRDNLANFIGKELFAAEYSSVPAGYVGHIDDVARYPHDIAKAKALLTEAGFPDGFSTDVIISSSVLYLPVMQVLQEQWKQAGINVALKVVDHPTFHRMIRQDASSLVIYNADRYPKTAQVYYDQFYAGPAAIGKPTAITNFSHYGDAIPGIDDLLDKARHATDPEEAKRLWAAAQKKVAEDVPSIPLYNQKFAIGRSAQLNLGYPLGNLPFYIFDRTKLRTA
jgi:peptide/nickel transport system substrate-binding protein